MVNINEVKWKNRAKVPQRVLFTAYLMIMTPKAAQFIDDLQNIITEYMTTSSYSVGISDLIADRKTQDSIATAITSQKQQVQSLIDQVHLGIFENTTANKPFRV